MKIEIWYFWNVWNTFHRDVFRSQETKSLKQFEMNFAFVIYRWRNTRLTCWSMSIWRSKKARQTKLVSRVYWEKLSWLTKLRHWWRYYRGNFKIYNSENMGKTKLGQQVYQEKLKEVLYWISNDDVINMRFLKTSNLLIKKK